MLLSLLSFAQSENEGIEKKKYTTQKLKSGTIKLDRIPNESGWAIVAWGGGDFVGYQPFEGQEPTYQTKFKSFMMINSST